MIRDGVRDVGVFHQGGARWNVVGVGNRFLFVGMQICGDDSEA